MVLISRLETLDATLLLYFYVETKRLGTNRFFAETGLINSLGQIATRMKDIKSARNYYALGLPEKRTKIALRRLPWQVVKKLPFRILSVSSDGVITSADEIINT